MNLYTSHTPALILQWGTPAKINGIPCLTHEGLVYDRKGYRARWLERMAKIDAEKAAADNEQALMDELRNLPSF